MSIRGVRRAMDELSYFADSHARFLVLRRSRIRGLIVSEITIRSFPNS